MVAAASGTTADADGPAEPEDVATPPASPEQSPDDPMTATATSEPADTSPASMPATDRPTPAVIETPAPATNGAFLIQLAAFRDQASAEQSFARLQRAHPTLLGSLRSDIERADLGDRGVFYRLRAGPLATKETASDLCTKLKAAGQDCLVRSRE